MGAVFILIINSGNMAPGSALSLKVENMNLTGDWNSYFTILTQAVGVGGVFVFGFAASWIFGREYSDGTAKDLLALPTSRTEIVHSKFLVYLIWCFALALSNLLIGLLLGSLLQIPSGEIDPLRQLQNYFNTTIMTVVLGTPIAFFAIWGKGYLAPLGFVALTLVFSQIIGASGFGYYFPWAIPGLYSGAGGEYKNQLNSFSYLILGLTSLTGYFITVYYWKHADHTK
jgi:ABC-2 type transport system permease protein